MFSLLFSVPACVDPAELGGCGLPDNLSLVWSDEFDGDLIDLDKWTFEIGDGCDRGICGWGNQELQYYTDRPVNASVSDGIMVITAKRETPAIMGQYVYSSARMITKHKGDWRFCRIEVRAKMPIGKGLWPAIWMLPTDNVYGNWPRSGEIDIMEYLGHQPSRVQGTIHYGHDYRRFNPLEYVIEGETFNDDFHVFSVEWTTDCITFFVDGNAYGSQTRTSTLPTTWPFDQQFYLLLNIAVGGNLPGNPDGSTVFPQTMKVDYVRVYQ